ncbi:MAG: hypothetical protein ACE5KI_07195 [Dehalococcoidia bacterium]
MRREFASIVIGVGIEVVFLILSQTLDPFPQWVAVCGYVGGGVLILVGGLAFIWPKQYALPEIETDAWPMGDALRIMVANAGGAADFSASAFLFPAIGRRLGEIQMVWESSGTNTAHINHGGRDYLVVGQRQRGNESSKPMVSVTRYLNGVTSSEDIGIPPTDPAINHPAKLQWQVMITSEPPMKEPYQGHYGLVGKRLDFEKLFDSKTPAMKRAFRRLFRGRRAIDASLSWDLPPMLS